MAAWNSGCSGGNGGSGFTEPGGPGSGANGAKSAGSGSSGGAGFAAPVSGGAPNGSLVVGGADGGVKAAAVKKCTSQGQCVNINCANGGHTTISGTVYDPAGVNPLYDVAVYVPQTKPSALPAGASCYSCQSLYTGGVVAGALTDPAGNFSIVDAPTGTGVPLVVQIGKWRRQYQVDVADCTDTKQPTLRLPTNASEGDLPNIAVSTGGSDSLECLLKRIGVDAGGDAGTGEYVSGAGGSGHIHIFQGGGGRGGRGGGGGGGPAMAGGSPASSTALWTSGMAMQPYDIVILSCEGAETANPNRQALNDYAALGGRVFASHFHYSWFNMAPFAAYNLATWTTGTQDLGNVNALIEQTLSDGVTPFPKGIAMQQWLINVNALSATTPPELPIQQSRHNADVAVANLPSTAWIVTDPMVTMAPGAAQYFSFDMPIPAAAQACGRVVYSDLHVGAASGDYGQTAGAMNFNAGAAVVPSGCASNALSPQEKALEFMLFDLSSCLTPVGDKPPPPAPAK
ncbi:MAG TPA: hypothetical protein VN894_14075 [Polyangiaceae bacterium]|nr:hypothetical protein [Polyangiaceae bacterium]